MILTQYIHILLNIVFSCLIILQSSLKSSKAIPTTDAKVRNCEIGLADTQFPVPQPAVVMPHSESRTRVDKYTVQWLSLDVQPGAEISCSSSSVMCFGRWILHWIWLKSNYDLVGRDKEDFVKCSLFCCRAASAQRDQIVEKCRQMQPVLFIVRRHSFFFSFLFFNFLHTSRVS